MAPVAVTCSLVTTSHCGRRLIYYQLILGARRHYQRFTRQRELLRMWFETQRVYPGPGTRACFVEDSKASGARPAKRSRMDYGEAAHKADRAAFCTHCLAKHKFRFLEDTMEWLDLSSGLVTDDMMEYNICEVCRAGDKPKVYRSWTAYRLADKFPAFATKLRDWVAARRREQWEALPRRAGG